MKSVRSVRNHLKQKLVLIDKQIDGLRAFRREVAQALKTCEESLKQHAEQDFCPVLQIGLNATAKAARR